MTTIVLQWLGVVVFVLATRVLGSRLKSASTSDEAQRVSRMGQAFYWACLACPLLLGLVYPGLSAFDALVGLQPLPFRRASLGLGATSVLAGIVLTVVSSMSLVARGRGAAAFKLTTTVVRSGVYSAVRNPMSLGFYLLCIGFGLVGGSTYWMVYTIMAVVPAHLFYVTYLEERELALRFGDDYEQYRRSTPLLFPRLSSYSSK